ncbi:MAG: type II secretion system protein GspN [Polyangiaceae bacterium]
MTLRERLARLEDRERRLLGILALVVGFILLLAIPFGVTAMLHGSRSDNAALRDVIQQINASRPMALHNRAMHKAVEERYARPAPPLTSFLATLAKEVEVEIPETQDRPVVPHGKRYEEKSTKNHAAPRGHAQGRQVDGAHRAVGLPGEHFAAQHSQAWRRAGLVRRGHRGQRLRTQARQGRRQAEGQGRRRCGDARREGSALMQLPKVPARWKKALRIAGYVNFYFDALALFAYLTFPYERVRDRIVNEFNARQTGPDALHLEIDSMGPYWFSGVQAKGIHLVSAPKPLAAGTDPSSVPKPSELTIEAAHGRIALLPLLIGSVRIVFGASALGGEISGETWESDGARHLEVELEALSLDKVSLLSEAVGLPLAGNLEGNVEFLLPEGKLAKADGKLQLKIKGLSAGDGKAKIRDAIALPKVEAGDLTLEGESTAGQLKITNFGASGPDLELSADGSVRLRDPANSSMLSLSARFKFADRYTQKNDTTRALFGTPGSAVPGLFDLDPKAKRAKGPDGFYGWRVSGVLSALTFAPHAGAGAPAGAPAAKH